MTSQRKHRCGGTLSPHQVVVPTDERSSAVALVPGFLCDRCREELIDRETSRELVEKSRMAVVPSWDDPGTSRTPMSNLYSAPSSSLLRGVGV